MLRDPLLKKAAALARRKKYDESVKLLEGEVFRYQDSFDYYHILGLICLYAGDFGGAHTYFNRAKNIQFNNPQNLTGLALLFLRRGQTDKALDLYLDIQDADPANPAAKRGLKLLRRYGGTEELQRYLETKKNLSLYPPLPRGGISFNPLAVLVPLFAAFLFLGISWGIKQIPVVQRDGLEASVLEQDDRNNPVETGGSYRIVLTRDEVLSRYNNARKLFNRYHDEEAKRELNRILESNASGGIKNKALLLKSYTVPPGFDTLKDHFSYAEVAADPALYRDCYVLWKGMAANIESEDQKVSFDLLVGYDTRKVMEGAVHVEVNFPAEIRAGLPLEVLGRLVITGGTQDKFVLEAAAIHQGPGN